VIVRITVSRVLSAEERAALARHLGKPSVGSLSASSWAQRLVAQALAALVLAEATCDTPMCALSRGHEGEHVTP